MTDNTAAEAPRVVSRSGAVGRVALALGILPGIGSGLSSFLFALVISLGLPVSSDFGSVFFFGGLILLGVLALLAVVFGILGVQRSRASGRLAAAAGLALGVSFLLATALGYGVPVLVSWLQVGSAPL
jgi:hypothetical protein